MYTIEDPEYQGREEDLLPDDEEIESCDLACNCILCRGWDEYDDLMDEVMLSFDDDEDGGTGIAND